MATRDVFSEDEMARLRSFPEIGRVELIRHFTLTDADEAFLRKFRTGRNVLGAAVQLCALPWLGYVPDDVSSAPDAAVGRLSQRLGVPMGDLDEFLFARAMCAVNAGSSATVIARMCCWRQGAAAFVRGGDGSSSGPQVQRLAGVRSLG